MKLIMVIPLAVSALKHRLRTRKVAAQNFDSQLLADEEFFYKLNNHDENCFDFNCRYREPHKHGFACDEACVCKGN
jgi:hypothetical protein